MLQIKEMILQKKGLILSISLTIVLVSLTFFTVMINNPNKVLAQPSKSSTKEEYHYARKVGSYETGNGQFSRSEGIAVDSSNNVYVVIPAIAVSKSSTATATSSQSGIITVHNKGRGNIN